MHTHIVHFASCTIRLLILKEWLAFSLGAQPCDLDEGEVLVLLKDHTSGLG